MKLDTQNLQQLSAVLEALQNPNHYGHAQAVEMAAEVNEAAHQERVENGQKMMQDQLDNAAEDEMVNDWWKTVTD